MTGMALEGVRVLDFTQMMMGPWATQFLGDVGADVIKVERPGTGEWERGLRAMGELLGGQSPFFLAMNRNKRSLTLNLKHPRAREVVLRLAETADLVTGLTKEQGALAGLHRTADAAEGIRAFLEKRAPRFTGE